MGFSKATTAALNEFDNCLTDIYEIGTQIEAIIEKEYGGDYDSFHQEMTSTAEYGTMCHSLECVLNKSFFEERK